MIVGEVDVQKLINVYIVSDKSERDLAQRGNNICFADHNQHIHHAFPSVKALSDEQSYAFVATVPGTIYAPPRWLQGYLAQKRLPPPQDHPGALGMVVL